MIAFEGEPEGRVGLGSVADSDGAVGGVVRAVPSQRNQESTPSRSEEIAPAASGPGAATGAGEGSSSRRDEHGGQTGRATAWGHGGPGMESASRGAGERDPYPGGPGTEGNGRTCKAPGGSWGHVVDVRVGPQDAPGDTWLTLVRVGGRDGTSWELRLGNRQRRDSLGEVKY